MERLSYNESQCYLVIKTERPSTPPKRHGVLHSLTRMLRKSFRSPKGSKKTEYHVSVGLEVPYPSQHYRQCARSRKIVAVDSRDRGHVTVASRYRCQVAVDSLQVLAAQVVLSSCSKLKNIEVMTWEVGGHTLSASSKSTRNGTTKLRFLMPRCYVREGILPEDTLMQKPIHESCDDIKLIPRRRYDSTSGLGSLSGSGRTVGIYEDVISDIDRKRADNYHDDDCLEANREYFQNEYSNLPGDTSSESDVYAQSREVHAIPSTQVQQMMDRRKFCRVAVVEEEGVYTSDLLQLSLSYGPGTFNATPHNSLDEIIVGVSENPVDAPALLGGQRLVSGVLVCMPHRASFAQPLAVTYTLPNTPLRRGATLRVLHSNTELTEPTAWQEAQDVKVLQQGNKLTLYLTHFCLYCVIEDDVQRPVYTPKTVAMFLRVQHLEEGECVDVNVCLRALTDSPKPPPRGGILLQQNCLPLTPTRAVTITVAPNSPLWQLRGESNPQVVHAAEVASTEQSASAVVWRGFKLMGPRVPPDTLDLTVTIEQCRGLTCRMPVCESMRELFGGKPAITAYPMVNTKQVPHYVIDSDSANPVVPSAAATVTPVVPSAAATVTPVVPSAAATVTPVVPSAAATVTPVVPSAAATVTPVVPSAAAIVTPVLPSTTATVTPVVPSTTATVTPVLPSTVATVTPVLPSTVATVTPVLPSTTATVTPVVPSTTATVTPVVPSTTATVTPVLPSTVATVTTQLVPSAHAAGHPFWPFLSHQMSKYFADTPTYVNLPAEQEPCGDLSQLTLEECRGAAVPSAAPVGPQQMVNYLQVTNNNYYRELSGHVAPGVAKAWPVSYQERRLVATYLDARDGWKMLASKLGVDELIDEIEWGRETNRTYSPTEQLLEKWMQQDQNHATCRQRLIKALRAMGRNDIADDLDIYLSPIECSPPTS